MKKIILLIVGVLNLSVVMAQEPETWSTGAFQDKGSDTTTARTNLRTLDDGKVEFSYVYPRKQSNDTFAQYPLGTMDDYAAISLPVNSSNVHTIQIWGNDQKTWHLLSTCDMKKVDGKFLIIPLNSVKSESLSQIRIIVPKQGNPSSGSLVLGSPMFTGKLDIDKQHDGLECLGAWTPVIWPDTDGKRRSKLILSRINAKSSGVALEVNYAFPDPKCTQVEFRLSPVQLGAERQISFELTGDGSENILQVWGKDVSGRSYLIVEKELNNNKSVEVGPRSFPPELDDLMELKFIIVKKSVGSGKMIVDGIALP